MVTRIPEYAILFGCTGLLLLVTVYNVYLGIRYKACLEDWLCIIGWIAAAAMVMVVPVWACLDSLL